jgi:hypothetical protein
MTMEERRYLEREIAELELKLQKQQDNDEPEWVKTSKQLRELRRKRI